MMSWVLKLLVVVSGIFLFGDVALATTYYVDYANGSDSNNGTTTSTPWQHAPGMNGCTASCNITPAAGSQIIFRGGITWPNSCFTWIPPSGGTAGNPVYYGVSQSYYSGSAWTRPIFDLQKTAPNNDNLYRIIQLTQSYMTLDNFEIKNVAGLPSPGNGSTNIFDWSGNQETNVTVSNMYIHGWYNPYFTAGIGNIAGGATTITNFVPFSYAPQQPASSWTSINGSVQLQGGGIPLGNGTPTVTSISGSNPYTIAFTNTAGPPSTTCNGCFFVVGTDPIRISGGVGGAPGGNNNVMLNNVIDGNDTAEVQMNPYGDCGLSEGNNNVCIASALMGWRQPATWRGNVVRFVANGQVGDCSEFSNNLIEYIRNSINPTEHTNVIECTQDDPVNGQTYFYNNVIRHMNNPNPATPSGQYSLGVALLPSPGTPTLPETAYVFNNVIYDTIQNAPLGRGGDPGSMVAFNNTMDCGPEWSLTYYCINLTQSNDIYNNNQFITTKSAFGGNSGYTALNNLPTAPSTATKNGYTITETYTYSPVSNSSPTVGKGRPISSFCSAISNSAASTACSSDTAYGPVYNTTIHTAVTPNRIVVSRPSTPSIGAYEFSALQGAAPVEPNAPSAPTGLTATLQ